jgi:[acyl-carrier-protein] S-malonyltransferase
VAAGTLEFPEAVRTVRERGRFMQDAVPVGRGSMAAILGLDAGTVERVCREAAHGEVVAPANLNAPGQIVIAGHAAAVARASVAAREAGAARVVTLPVSAPFHSPLMEPAAARLRAVLEALEFREPRIPVYANVDAAPVTDAAAARDALARQVASPVRWEASVRAMIASGIREFVEVGPGHVLGGLVRRIDRSVRVLAAGTPEEVEQAAAELGGGRR